VVAVVPVVLYWVVLQAGSYPNRAEWLALQMNHGPWRWEPPGIVLNLCYLALAFIVVAVLVHGSAVAARARAPIALLPPLATAAFTGVLLHLELIHLFWLID
jgi:hypothetical protein